MRNLTLEKHPIAGAQIKSSGITVIPLNKCLQGKRLEVFQDIVQLSDGSVKTVYRVRYITVLNSLKDNPYAYILPCPYKSISLSDVMDMVVKLQPKELEVLGN